MTACYSDLKLEAFLLAPERSELAAHLEACLGCRERLDEMRHLEEEFRREVYPATVEAVVTSARPRSLFPRWAFVVAPLAAAAAAIAIFLAWPHRGSPEMGLAIYASTGAGLRSIQDGAEVPANAALHFEVEPASPCCLWVLSVDATGDIVRLYPPKGDAKAEAIVQPAARQRLPTVAVLDGRTGPQRIFAVCTKSPVPWGEVKGAAAINLKKGEDAVRSFRAIGNLPPGAVQSSVLLEKRS